jgi:peroxiredoxin
LQHALAEVDAGSAALTPQSAKDNRETAGNLGLNILLLSDAGGHAPRTFGLHFKLPADITALARAELGAAAPPPDRTGRSWLPMSASYVIRANGVIAYSELDPRPAQASTLTNLQTVLSKL